MDTLLNAYRDDEEDDSETIPQIQPTPIQINPTPESNSIELNPTQESNSIELNPTQESNLAENNPIHESTVAIENNPICENSSKIEENPFVESNRVRIGEEIDALNPNPDPTTSPKEVGYEEPEYKPEEMEVELTNMSENLGSEDVSSESISEEDPNPDYSDTKKLMGDEELEEIEEEEEEEEDDDEETPLKKKKKQKSMSNFEVDQSELIPESQMTPLNGNEGVGSGKKSSNKKKTKGNNVWTKTTSRKGKKKAKNSHNGSNGGSNNVVAPKAEDTVLITPIPRFPDKNDDSPEAKICLSKVNKAEKVELSEDRMSAGSCKGYRMVRATRGVNEGAWYYEIKVVSLGETGHTRLGWSTEKGDLQAPVGYDANSFGYRDIDGSKIHKALREKYGEEGYKEGDVIGFYINLPDGSSYAPQPPRLVWYKGQKYVCAPDPKEDPPKIIPGSEISFFKNGICQGVAFKDLFGGRYFPAASMYTLPNQPNCVVKFNFGPDFECFPTDFEGRPVPNPMIDVLYHGFDNRDENGVLDEIKQ